MPPPSGLAIDIRSGSSSRGPFGRGEPVDGEPTSRTAKAALHFIGNQSGPGFSCQFPRAPVELFRNRSHASVPLHGFEDDGGDVVTELPFQVLWIVEPDEIETRDQGGERFPVVLVMSGRKGPHRSAVECAFDGENAIFAGLGRRGIRENARELQGAFDGFSPAV